LISWQELLESIRHTAESRETEGIRDERIYSMETWQKNVDVVVRMRSWQVAIAGKDILI